MVYPYGDDGEKVAETCRLAPFSSLLGIEEWVLFSSHLLGVFTVGGSSSRPGQARWGRRLLFLGAAVAVLFVGVTLFLSRYLDPEALATRLEPRLEAALVREVEVGGVEVGLFPLGVRLRDVTVADPTGLAPFLARVESLEFQARLIPLFRREVQIARLVLENPSADLRVSSEGRSNFGDFSTQPSEVEPDSLDATFAESFGLDLKGIRISGGTLHFENLDDSTSIEVEDLKVNAGVRRESMGPWLFQGDSEATVTVAGRDASAGGAPRIDAAEARPSTGPMSLPLSLTFDLEAGPTFERLEIRSGSVGVEPVFLTLAGTIEALKEPTRTVDLTLSGERTPLAGILAFLSSQLDLQVPGEAVGTVNSDVRVEGSLGPGFKPEVSGTVTLSQGGLVADDGTLVAQDLAAEVGITRGGAVRFSLNGEVLDGPFSLEGTGATGGQRALEFQLRGKPDLGLVEKVVSLPDGVTAVGRLDTQLRGNGSVDNLRSFRFWGDLAPADVVVTHPAVGVPVGLAMGRISLDGTGGSFQALPVTLDEDQITVTGEVRSFMSYGLPGRAVLVRGSVRGPRLDLVAVSTRPPADSALTYGKVAFAKVGGRTVAGRTPEEAARELRLSRPDSLPIAGSLQVAFDTLVYSRGMVQDLRAQVEFGPSFVRVNDARMKRFGGDISTNMNMTLGPLDREPFNMNVQVQELDASEFLAANSPLGGAIRGRLSMSLDLIGFLDGLLLPEGPSLVGSGSFALTDGGVNSIPLTASISSFMGLEGFRSPAVESWSSSFFISEGQVRLGEGTITGAPGDPRVNGSIGLDGGLDLLSVFVLDSEQLGSHALDNLGITDPLAGRLPDRPGFIQAVVHIAGTLLAPELRADPAAAVRTVAEGVTEQAQAEAQRQIQEQRNRLQDQAAGMLRNLLQPRAPVTNPSPDTLRGDSLRPDTVPPDTLQPDTATAGTTPLEPVPLDSLVGDSLRPDTVPPDTSRIRTLLRPGG